MPGKKDAFANIATLHVVESAANTLTYAKLETGIALFEKVAWLIHRIEFYLSTLDVAHFAAEADTCYWALLASNTLTTLIGGNIVKEPSVIFGQRAKRTDWGAAATGLFIHDPYVNDFSTLPGGGLIVPPNPLYIAVEGNAAPQPFTVDIRMYYSNYQLAGADEYWELVESRRVISV